MRRTVSRATSAWSTVAREVISPASTTLSSLQRTSHATRLDGSWARYASRIASAMLSHTLSGWPSETDSEVKVQVVAAGARVGAGLGALLMVSPGAVMDRRCQR